MRFDVTYRYELREGQAQLHPADSGAALCRLCNGNRLFSTLFSDTADGRHAEVIVDLDLRDVGFSGSAGGPSSQRPFAAVLGCSDARVPIELIFNEGPNDLFVLRVAGNGLGTEVLGSLKYAVDYLGGSLRLIVVLGHSGCGAVTTAVDVFLQPAKYLPLATKHSLRSIVDRLLVVVQAAARQLLRTFGHEVESHPGFREALIEASIMTNAALAAYSIQQELGSPALRAVYGVYVLETRHVWAPGPGGTEGPSLAAPPGDASQFAEFTEAVVRSDRIRRLLGPSG
jgi:carbonic anhydrase